MLPKAVSFAGFFVRNFYRANLNLVAYAFCLQLHHII